MSNIRQQTLYPDSMDDADVILPGKRKRRNLRPEDALQMGCIKLIRQYQRAHPGTLQYIVAQPENSRTLWKQQHDKAMGRLGNAGHHEILLLNNNPLRDWFIELKVGNNKLSDAQLGWYAWAVATGRNQATVRTLEQFRLVLANF